MTDFFDRVLNWPTLPKGIYYRDHKRLMGEYLLWLAFSPGPWMGDYVETYRIREFRHYVEALGVPAPVIEEDEGEDYA